MRVSDGGRAERIGIVLHDFAAGGTERVAIRLANAWADAGRRVVLFCGCASGPARAHPAASITVVETAPPIPRGPWSRLRLGRALPGMLAGHPVDALVAPGNFHLPVLRAAGRLPCAVACKLSNPLVRADRSRLRQWLFPVATRRSLRHVDCVVAMSPALAREARALRPKRVETLFEAILPASGDGTRAAPAARLRIVCAGRMVSQKRFDLALRTFAALARDDIELVLLGDGPERIRLEAQAAALGIADSTRIVGQVPDIAPWLASADALLMTSAYEGYPAVLVEAIATGVRVVTTDCSPAIREILLHPSFGTIAAAEPAALAAALARVLDGRRVDDAARRVLVGRHLVSRAAGEWLAMLDNLVAARAG